MTEPSGSYWGYRAAAIGSGAPTIIEELETSYEKEAETIQAGFHVALRALKKVSDDELDPDMIEIAIIPLDSRKLSYLNSTDIINLLNEL
jgi:20S proteasome alpha/beta subunit